MKTRSLDFTVAIPDVVDLLLRQWWEDQSNQPAYVAIPFVVDLLLRHGYIARHKSKGIVAIPVVVDLLLRQENGKETKNRACKVAIPVVVDLLLRPSDRAAELITLMLSQSLL